jgi:hypothetical protein
VLAGRKLYVKSRRFFGSTEAVYTKTFTPYFTSSTQFYIKSLPDFYLESDQASNDNFFYSDYFNETTILANQYGIINFGINKEQVSSKAMYEIGFFYEFGLTSQTYPDTEAVAVLLNLYDIALCLKKSVSIKDKIYTGTRGRVFNDTWDSRRTATAMIETPIDIIEHCARLQNWSEVGDNKKWGTEYSPGALIKTTDTQAVGSFKDDVIDAVGGTDVSLWKPQDLACAGQILSYDDAYTDTIMRQMARLTWCALRQDNNGYECIHYLPDTTAPTEAVSLVNIVGTIGNIIEPKTSDIFCCPTVRYNYNYGSGKYEGIIEIKNPNDPTSSGYVSAYAPGANQTGNLQSGVEDGQVIWLQCARLWSKYKQIEAPPAELTDLPLVREYTTAIWYLYQWVMWQGKRGVSFNVPYSVGSSYFCGMRATLSLPNQTNSQALQILITSTKKDKTNDVVGISALLLQEPTSAVIYQDTDAGSVAKYQDTDVGGTTVKWQNIDG